MFCLFVLLVFRLVGVDGAAGSATELLVFEVMSRLLVDSDAAAVASSSSSMLLMM